MINNLKKFSVNKSSFYRSFRGFSLVEVVVAVGIFALAIVGVIGLLAPTSKSIADVSDSDAASRVISAVQSGLQTSGFTQVKAGIDASTVFYASKDGSKVGPAGSLWTSDTEKFFEFQLIRNTTLSPSSSDDAAGFLAFTVVLKWPAFRLTGPTTAVAVDDNTQKSVMIVPAAVTR